jgi:hypothetical protein
MKDIKGNIITVGDTVKVVGNNFPNVAGVIINVEEDRVDLAFRCFYRIIEEDKATEMWDMVSLKGTDVVKVDNKEAM